ncbi:MAG: glycine--tRNA ligase [Planctomycetes bacterium]|nr:glycine--tRNA ligase [Planctomycetota bacterium]
MPARSLDQIRRLAKNRGFIFAGSAPYGGLGSFWDYGPLGVEMLNHVKRSWWQNVVYNRDDVEGVDCAILMNRKVWQHSGHEATFSDPLVDCKSCRARFRADHLVTDAILARETEGENVHRKLRPIIELFPVSLKAAGLQLYAKLRDDEQDAEREANRRLREFQDKVSNGEKTSLDEFFGSLANIPGMPNVSQYAQLFFFVRRHPNELRSALLKLGKVSCPKCQKADWTDARNFNLMFQSHVGPVEANKGTEEELASRVYLRPETAQGIFMNFKNVLESSRRKVPFGIAQIGKAFRNEITPGNFTFRTREFEQMELEFFIKPPQFLQPGEKTDEQWHEEWVEQRYNWWLGLGIDKSRIRKRAQTREELAHYSKATVDLEYLFPGSLGFGEIEGIANRTDYDLSAHSKDVPEDALKRLKLEKNADSVENLDYFDQDAKARYFPWVIEPSCGATRAMLAFLCEAYNEELVKPPAEADIAALKTEIDAAIKNAEKKKKEAEKEKDAAQRKHDPVAIEAFIRDLTEATTRLPQSLAEIDGMLKDHAGAQNLELVKKLSPKVSKLAEDHTRLVLKLHPSLAPVKLAIFPLKKNEPRIVDEARRIKHQFQHLFRTVYDDSAGIGKLYRRQDEIGTPLCITVDFQTLEDNTVTLRDRDTMQQIRVPMEKLKHEVFHRLGMPV